MRYLLLLLCLCAAFGLYAEEPVDSVVYAPADTTANYEALEGVEVVATRPIIQTEADRLIYNVEDDPVSVSNTALDMMRKVPMLSVDGEDNITIKGSSAFKIYLNGKPDPTLSSNYKEVLRAMPASTIKKIEVITDPGAKYEAEGLAGIINIVTFSRASIEGYLLNLGLYTGESNTSEYIYGTTKIRNVTLALNYSHGNQYGAAYHGETVTNYLENPQISSRISTSRSKQPAYYNNGGLNLSWEPDTLNLYTVTANVWQYRISPNVLTSTRLLGLDNSTVSSYDMLQSGSGNNLGLSAQTNWQHNFTSPEHNIVVSYLYNYSCNKTDYDYLYTNLEGVDPLTYTDRQYFNRYPNHEHTFQADYAHPFSSRHTLEVGGKYILRNNYGDTEQRLLLPEGWTLDEDNSVSMKQFQNVGALYASYTGRFGPLMARLGLRYEFTHMGTRFHTPGHTDFTTDLNDPVPSALLSYRLTDASQLKLAYRMTISRPAVSQLDPTINSANPLSISYGNPDLSSSRGHTTSLTYSNYSGIIGGEASVNYRRTDNLISSYSFSGEGGVINTTYGNIGYADNFNASIYLNLRPISGLSLNVGGTIMYNHYLAHFIDLDRDGWGYQAFMSGEYSLPKHWELSMYAGLYDGGVYMQYNQASSHWYGLSVAKTIADRLTISLSASDFFEPYLNYHNSGSGPGFIYNSSTRYHNWSINFGVRLRLGSLNTSVKRTARSVANDDVSTSSGSSSGSGSKGN